MRKIRSRMLTCLMVVLMVMAMIPTVAFAAEGDADAKTLTVEEGGDYATIQAAIDYIDNQSDKTGWTINVEAGEYDRFTVLDGMDNLTVKASDNIGDDEAVVVNVMHGTEAPVIPSGGYPDPAGVSIRVADNVTIQGLIFDIGTQNNPWFASAISTKTESNKGNNLTVKECAFMGEGTGIGVLIDNGTTKFVVESCYFDGLKEAISMYGDTAVLDSANISNNIFEDCNFALHGYYGGTGDAGTLTFADNDVTGTESLRCKIVIQDNNNNGAIKVQIKDNFIENGIIGLVNLREQGEANDVLSENDFSENSHFVEAIEPGTIEFSSTYKVPEGSTGKWVLTENDDLEVDWGHNPDGTIEFVQKAIDEANAKGSLELSITGIDEDQLIKTFTWFKDAIYWESSEEPVTPPVDPTEPTEPTTPTTPTDTPKTDIATQTSDDFNMTAWMIVMIVAAAGAVAATVRRKAVK